MKSLLKVFKASFKAFVKAAIVKVTAVINNLVTVKFFFILVIILTK